jgi:hypothetical protein
LETLEKIISIMFAYSVLVENQSLLNKKFTNHEETNNKTHTITSSLYHDGFLNFDWSKNLSQYKTIPLKTASIISVWSNN